MRLVRPLRERDFALLFCGQAVSLLGDGVYSVALAWLVYEHSGSPASLALVGLARSAGMVSFLLLGGVAADRVERRRLIIAADLARAAAIGAMGLLALGGVVETWELCLLALLAGAGEGFFGPAMVALVPQLIGGDDLVQANALQEVTRPIWARLAGPALGGLLVGTVGAGTALVVDAVSFVVGVATVAMLAARPLPATTRRRMRADLRAGFEYTRREPWLWATLLMVAITLLFNIGPMQVLLPFVIKHDLGYGATAYAAVLAIGGAGAILGGLVMSRRGMGPRAVRTLFVAWGIASLAPAGFGIGALWPLAVASLVLDCGVSVGMVIWATLMQSRVPAAMMGRVSSVDWMVSLGLVPISYALAGPAGELLGARTTLVACGVLGGITTVAIYALVPGLRADRFVSAGEGGDVGGEVGVGDGGSLHPDDHHPIA